MCLAIPPNSVRSQHYALPYSFSVAQPQQSYSAESSASSPSAGAAAAAAYGNRSGADSCHVQGGGITASAATASDRFSTSGLSINSNYGLSSPSTTPDFNSGLGPTGLSPVLSRFPSAGVNGCGAVTTSVTTSAAGKKLAPSDALASFSAKSASTTTKRRRRCPQRPGKTATDKERLFVQHNYHDLSLEPDLEPIKSNKTSSATTAAPLVSESFPMKLHRILEETEAAGQSHIIGWQPHGRAFKIRNPTLFTAQIMPLYFPKMKKLTSLQRQFNLYGFERLTRDGSDAGAYYHEAFLRYRPGLSAQRMFRRRVKGTGYKAASNPDAEPDLYALPSMDEVMGRMNSNSVGCIANNQLYHQATASQEANNHQESMQAVPITSSYGNSFSLYDSAAGVVTDSARSSFNDSRSGEESTSTHQDSCAAAVVTSNSVQQLLQNQWIQSNEVASSMVAQVPMSSNFQPRDSFNDKFGQDVYGVAPQQQQVQVQPQVQQQSHQELLYNQVTSSTSIDQFLALPEATQDSLLQDFFSGNDVTPLSPNVHNRGVAAASAQQPPALPAVGSTAGDHPILQEFADLWENARLA